jgi:hypothetical protein
MNSLLLLAVSAISNACLPQTGRHPHMKTVVWDRPHTIGRRDVLITSVLSCAVTLGCLPAAARERTAVMSREDAVNQVTGQLPCFLVVNSEGMPYLTDVDAKGRRSGSVFMGPRDAAVVLREVQKYDASASLAILSLASVYEQIAKTSADAERARDVAPQPRTSTSADFRLFQLRPLGDETAEAVSLLPGATMLPGVTLYYEPDLLLGADATARRRPFFLRMADLNMVWRRGNGPARDVGQVSPSMRVLSLEGLIRAVEMGEFVAIVPPVVMPPSETAELQYKSL